MPCPVEAGNKILVPFFSAESAESIVHIKWSQNLVTRNADYYSLVADNITTGEFSSVLRQFGTAFKMCIIQAHRSYSLLLPSTIRTAPKPIPTISPKLVSSWKAVSAFNLPYFHSILWLVSAEGYKLNVDSRLQYGQKNANGELRFIVFHDQERKPYQVS